MVDLISVGFLIMLVGVVVIFAAILKSSGVGKGEVKGGGVLLVGPIPIAFGSDAKWASVAITLAIALILLTIVLYVGWP